MENKIRVRYAPSPTGYLHIGGARSALFNYLFAKKFNGDFVFRIEDTDIERNIEGAEASQLHDLIWLGIVPDESFEKPNPKYGPYRQTEKLDLYRNYAKILLDKGFAYECYTSEEEIEQLKLEQEEQGISSFKYEYEKYKKSDEEIEKLKSQGVKPSIRIKFPKDAILEFNDLVRGKVRFNSNDFGDFVIIKSNGFPTYNFAVCIDDHLMEITHILRGEEHLSNTPKQMIIYNYFNWETPTFGHMTIIINENGKKLSKRDHNILQFMSQYKELGYLPEAITNFILMLGWTPNSEKEIFTLEEAIKEFDPKRLSSSPSMFDAKKLLWMNSHYIKEMSDLDYYEFIKPFILESNLKDRKDIDMNRAALIFKKEINYGYEIINLVNDAIVKHDLNKEQLDICDTNESQIVYKEFIGLLENIDEINKDSIKELLDTIKNKTNIKGKMLFMPLRLAISGLEHGVELFNLIYLVGKEDTIWRIKECIK